MTDIANLLKLDSGLLMSFIKIIMCEFNPLNREKQAKIGDAELAIKGFIAIILPNLDI